MDDNCVEIKIRNLLVGDLVYVVDSAHTYGVWCLGLVIDVYHQNTMAAATTWLIYNNQKIVFGDNAKFLLVNRPPSQDNI